ncbi:hypothetical protein QG37_07129 [Candidozyma auris]|nr:hypothetical protein QG37_07129 [[Candida] auris]
MLCQVYEVSLRRGREDSVLLYRMEKFKKSQPKFWELLARRNVSDKVVSRVYTKNTFHDQGD